MKQDDEDFHFINPFKDEDKEEKMTKAEVRGRVVLKIIMMVALIFGMLICWQWFDAIVAYFSK